MLVTVDSFSLFSFIFQFVNNNPEEPGIEYAPVQKNNTRGPKVWHLVVEENLDQNKLFQENSFKDVFFEMMAHFVNVSMC